MMIQNKKIILVVCSVLLLAFSLFASSMAMIQGDSAKKVNLINSAMLTQYPAGLATVIARIFAKKGINVERVQKIGGWDITFIEEKDFYKLDFSNVDEGSYGDNPAYEVFNPEGGAATPPNKNNFLKLAENPEFYYTIGNRIKGNKTDKTDLLMIISGLRDVVCKTVQAQLVNKRNINEVALTKIEKINLTPYPQEVPKEEIVVLPSRYGCVETPDGYYYYHLLVER